MASNRYTFTTTLVGFVRLDEDGGKFNNRGFAFNIPDDALKTIEADRLNLIAWIKSKENKRMAEGFPRWTEQGFIKYSYGEGSGERKPIPEPIIIDTNGDPVKKEILATVREGTKVNIILQQKPFAYGTYNTSIRVIGVQIVELNTVNGAVDSGVMSAEDVAAMFGTVDGFKADSPAVRPAAVASEDSYDF